MTMKTKRIFAMVFGIVLLISTVGCKQNKIAAISEPNVLMKTVTQKSDGNFVSFTCEIPETWETSAMDYFSIFIANQSNIEKDFGSQEEGLPFVLLVGNYLRSGGAGTDASEELKQAYKDLFLGKADAYKNYINTYVAYLNGDAKEIPSDFGSLVLTPNLKNMEKKSFAKKQYLKDFKIKNYNGKNGKITEVQYSFNYNEKTYHQIRCIRQDIPYMTLGAFSDSVNLSTGQIALWVADSLKISEHF